MADMVFLTKLKPEPKGTYDASTAYGINSLVMSADGAAAYLSVKDVPAGTPLTNTEYWKIHTDLSLVKKNAEEAAEKALAARDEMIGIARNLTNPVEAEGNPVQEVLVGGLPFDKLATVLEPVQAGSGDPAPDNIRPIGGWTGAKMTRAGRNVLPNAAQTQTISGVTFTPNADKSITVNGTAAATVFYPLSEAAPCASGAYVLRGTPAGGGNATFALRVLTSSGGQFDDIGNGQTFAVASGSTVQGYIIIRSGYAASNLRFYPGLYLQSDTQTEYEPYQGNAYAADFGQIVYGGELNWQTGVLTVGWRIARLTSNGNWVKSGTALNGYYLTDSALFPNKLAFAPVVCNIARYVSDIDEHKTNYGTIYADNTVSMNIAPSVCGSTLESFKAWLDANDVQIAYKLANPTTIQLTPQEIAQLEGINTLYGDGSIAIIGRQKPDLALVSRIEALESAILNA